MNIDPKRALDILTEAFQEHLAAMSGRRAVDDPAVVRAYDALAEAFFSYQEAVFAEYDEYLPMLLEDEIPDEEPEDEDEDDFEDGLPDTGDGPEGGPAGNLPVFGQGRMLSPHDDEIDFEDRNS